MGARLDLADLFGLVHVLLAELEVLEPRDDLRAKPPTQQQRRDHRPRAAEGDVAEDTQKGEVVVPCCVLRDRQQVVAEVVKHSSVVPEKNAPVVAETLGSRLPKQADQKPWSQATPLASAF